MADREKVIRGLERCKSGEFEACTHCPYDGHGCEQALIGDAIALLKEQEPPIRCAECRYFRRGGNPEGFGWCDRPGAGCSLPEDYYCKYGTKEDDNEDQT